VLIKILLISNTFWPAKFWGGPIFSTFYLFDSVTKQDPGSIFVEVLTTNAGDTSGLLDLECAEGVAINDWMRVSYFKRIGNTQISIGLIKALVTRAHEFDVVYVNGVFSELSLVALVVSRLKKIKSIIAPRGSLYFKTGEVGSLKKKLFCWALRLVSSKYVWAHSTSGSETLTVNEKLSGMKVIELPNGVVSPSTSEIRPRQAHNKFQLLFVGRLHPKKQVEVAIESLVYLKRDHTLWIAGEGCSTYTQHLENLCVKLGVSSRVSFLGFVDGKEKEELYANSGVLLLPSKHENFGNVVLESLAFGTPVVASVTTPWSVLEKAGCGECVPTNAKDFASAVRRLVGEGYERKRVAAKNLAMEYDWHIIGDKFSTIISAINKECM